MNTRQRPRDLTEYVVGSEISTDDWNEWTVAVSEHGQATFYLGLFDEHISYSSTMYHVAAATRGKTARRDYRFIRAERGCVYLDAFLNDTTRYRVLGDCIVRLPVGSRNYFGVIQPDADEENILLTRNIFGTTFDELNQLLAVYALVVDGPPDLNWNYPRITFSKMRHNQCDLTGAFIPHNFPYIAFTESTYFRGHVSLYGFYMLLAMLCDQSRYTGLMVGNRFYQELLVNGAPQAALDFAIKSATAVHAPLLLGKE